MEPCPFGIPAIAIRKSDERSFSSVTLRELSFAPMSCDRTNTFYELLYPERAWAGKQTCKATKVFMDETKTYYEVRESAKHYIKEPLTTDAETTYYHSYDQNHNSFCLGIHEQFTDGNTCVTYYKDGPLRHLLRDGDTWQSESLTYEDEAWVLDISCQNTVSSNWIVSINGNEIPCMKRSVFAVPYRGVPLAAQSPEFLNQYYFNADGLCVLLRRYMGSVWEAWKNEFWRKLSQSDSIVENGHRFYLYCDYVPQAFLGN